jgi:hypothetical protein
VEDGSSRLLWFLLEVVLIATGKVVVTVVSSRRWRGEDLSHREGRIFGPAGALWFKREGQVVVAKNGLLFAGALFYVALVTGLFWWA